MSNSMNIHPLRQVHVCILFSGCQRTYRPVVLNDVTDLTSNKTPSTTFLQESACFGTFFANNFLLQPFLLTDFEDN